MNVNNSHSEVVTHEETSPVALLPAQDTTERECPNHPDTNSSLVFGNDYNDYNDETLMDDIQTEKSVDLSNVLEGDTSEAIDMDIDSETIPKSTSAEVIISNEEKIKLDINDTDKARHLDVTQSINDTQVINEDTQVINHDTQVINQNTQPITQFTQADTHPLNLSPVNITSAHNKMAHFEVHTQAVAYNQILGDTQIIEHLDGKILQNADTQIIGTNSSNETEEDHIITDESNKENGDITQIINSVSPNVQIPDTAKHLRSHTQVINTQESPIKNGNQLSIHYSTSNIPSGEIEEVKTEDEDEDEDEDEKEISQTPEDSLITTKLKRKYNDGLSDIPRKLLKTPIILNNKRPQIIQASPIEIEDSSPVVKKSDILKLRHETSPLKLSKQPKLTKIDLRPPSSPEVASMVDSDQEERMTPGTISIVNENIKQSPHIAARRRKKYVIESQDDPTTITNSTFKRNIFRNETSELLTELDIICNESVWVSYNLKMYTGCLIEYGNEYSKIEFDEGVFTIKNSDIYLLDIRIGDSICIKNSASKYRVTGLSFAESQSQIKCIRGFNVVYLQRYSKNKEFPEISTQLCECFMDIVDWVQHQQNFKLIYADKDLLQNNTDTPLRNGTQLSTISERATRSIPYTSPIRNPNIRKLSIGNSGKVFSQKIFFITSIEGERKEEITNLIRNNGGIVINEDLYSMFNYQEDVSDHLRFNIDMEDIEFGAMISNNYCRSAKYLQALALGWPILSDAFIVDCCQDSSIFKQWPVYLLPAGKSKYLKSIKSLEIYNYRKNFELDHQLKYQLQNNHHLLENYQIIIFNNKSSDTFETCKFIFYSFGVKTIKYQSKLDLAIEEIKKLLRQDQENILVYDDSNTILTRLQDQGKSQRKTRSNTSNINNITNSNKIKQKLLQVQEQTIGLINWEWVVQCVISSYIWSPRRVPFEEK